MYDIVTIGEVCEVIAGQSPPSDTYNKNGEGLPFFQGKADFGNLYPEKIRIWCRAPQKIAEEGDVLISVRAPVGPTNICNQRACIGRGLSAIRAGNKVDPKFLLYFLRKYEPKLASQGKGSTFMSITQKDIKRIQMPLPPLEDQKRIVSLLDQADTLRRKRKESMKVLDEYVQAVFMEMFGHPKNKAWPKRKLAELARKEKGSMRTGPFGSDLKHSEFVDEGVAVIGIDNAVKNRFSWDERRYITHEKYAKLKRYTVHPRDVLVTIMGTVGRTAVVPDDVPLAINTKHLVALSLNESVANAQFIAYSIHSDPNILHQIDSKGRGAIMTGLNLGVIKNLEIQLPPIALQNDFERIYKTKEMLRAKMLMQETEIENQFNALMLKAFAGTL